MWLSRFCPMWQCWLYLFLEMFFSLELFFLIYLVLVVALGIVNLLLIKKFFNYLFIFVCAGSSLMPGLFSSWSKWGLLSSCGAWASHCGGFSCHGVQTLGYVGSVVMDPRPGIEPVSPALAGGFFATEPPGKPFFSFLKNIFIYLAALVLVVECGI